MHAVCSVLVMRARTFIVSIPGSWGLGGASLLEREPVGGLGGACELVRVGVVGSFDHAVDLAAAGAGGLHGLEVEGGALVFVELGGELEELAAAAGPAVGPGGGAVDHAVGGHVVGDHGAGADKAVGAQRRAADDGGVGADGGAAAHAGGGVFFFAFDVGPGGAHVGEHGRGADEDLFFEEHAVVDRDIVLKLHAVADGDVTDVSVLTDDAVASDLGAGHDVAEVPDLGVGSNGGARVHHGGGVDKGFWEYGGHLLFNDGERGSRVWMLGSWPAADRLRGRLRMGSAPVRCRGGPLLL